MAVEIGAGTAIPTVRHFSHAALIGRDAVPVRFNPGEPEVPRSCHVFIASPALAALLAIDEALYAR